MTFRSILGLSPLICAVACQSGADDSAPFEDEDGALVLTQGTAEEPAQPLGVSDCETAFAYTADDLAFCSNDMDGDGEAETRWGWFGLVDGPGSYAFELIAGARRCDASKGTHVGTFDLEYDGATVLGTFTAFDGYAVIATHLYVDEEAMSTMAPGQFTSVQEGALFSSITHSVSGFTAAALYFSAHAEVCSVE